jgi:hypothetical protein
MYLYWHFHIDIISLRARTTLDYEPSASRQFYSPRLATTMVARAPRLYRQGSSPLHTESTTQVDPVRKYGAKIDLYVARDRKGASSTNLCEGKENLGAAAVRESSGGWIQLSGKVTKSVSSSPGSTHLTASGRPSSTSVALRPPSMGWLGI